MKIHTKNSWIVYNEDYHEDKVENRKINEKEDINNKGFHKLTRRKKIERVFFYNFNWTLSR